MSEVMKQRRATYHLYTFLVSKMISSLGANVYSFGMSMFILSITGSALSFAANLIFSIIPRILLSPVAGILTDRLPRKAVVLVGQGGVILSVTCLLTYSLLFDLSITAIYVTTVFYTISSTFSSIAFSASISNLVDQERIQKAMSFNQMSLSVSGIGGPIVGGMLFGFVSMEMFLLINIISYLIAFLLESTMNFNLYSKKLAETKSEDNMLESFKEGLQYLKTKPIISRLLLVVLWLNLFFTSVSVGTNFILVEVLKMEYSLIGFVEASGAIGMLLVSIYFAARSNIKYPLQFSKRAVLGLSVLVGTIAIPLMFHFSASMLFMYFLLIMFLFGSFSVLTNTPIGVMLQKDVDENYRGRVFGILEMMAMGLMPIGSLVFGILYDIVSAEIILIVCSVLLVMITLVLLPSSLIRDVYPELESERNYVKSATLKNTEMQAKKQIANEYRDHVTKQKQLSNPTTSRL
ncbi:MFS transporter [Lysinibacillus sp. SGAir0095]|uniref:MFS transporter n=1 Tax=Lysinibacillus sp. SGAir0095 TaxID=2070463 RepID=UPI0010CD431A|nr:MFS transporter [Lysinibacillus sp. SGAir0095]QCR32607.1 MFS transporter [Lysinibacillus sp. SGAir0095]